MLCLKIFPSLGAFVWLKTLWKKFILSSSMKQRPLKWKQATSSEGFSR